MKLHISENSVIMGQKAALEAARILKDAVEKQGSARLLLSTGQSQFAFFDAFVEMELPWEKIEVFHLDEYAGLSIAHPASFRKYLKERFMDRIRGGTMHYIDGEGDPEAVIAAYTAAIREKPIDLGMIGIGENGHIAFNDPPADFDTQAAYHVVELDDKCRRQQVGEGWFVSVDEVPRYAISATVSLIMSCRNILSVVPHTVKADAVQKTLETPGAVPLIPATKMKEHPAWQLYLDTDSASMLSKTENVEYGAKLKYHYQTKSGWVNDPNGLVYFQGYYHVFYQHAPHYERPWNEPMHWGHARTKDFLRWEELPVALAPDMHYDREGCWSGTAIVKDDTLYLFYASIPQKPYDVQTVSVACSKDGVHFEKYAENPVIGGFPADGCKDFRDPAVTEIDGKYYCVMASGNKEQTIARLLLYRSEDLIQWEYQGILCEWEGGKITECPSFMQSGENFLLTASVCWQEGHNFSVMYGDFSDGKYTVKASAEVDKGPDQYAGQVFRDHKGRCILMSWIPGWSYDGYTNHDVGCMSVPREMKWENGRITGYPVKELQHLLKTEDPAVQRTDKGFVIPRTGREPVVFEGEIRELAILRDEYVVEVFVNGGEEIYSALL